MLVGREKESEAVARVLDQARRGQGEALVLVGEAGIGKTALIDELTMSAHGVQILRSTGSEAEMELPFSSLQRLCSSVLDDISHLSDPQGRALSVAFGLAGGDPPDRLIVGLALVNFLSKMASEGAVLCVLDDAQWMDQASSQAIT